MQSLSKQYSHVLLLQTVSLSLLCDCAFLFPIFAMWSLFSLSSSHSSPFGNLKVIKNDLTLMLSNIWECGYFTSTSSNFISKTESIYFLLWKKREFTHLKLPSDISSKFLLGYTRIFVHHLLFLTSWRLFCKQVQHLRTVL